MIKSHWTGPNRYTAEIAYDRNSNITSVDDARHSVTGKGLFDAAYTMDNLNRLTSAREGHLATGAIGTGDRTREELWTSLSQTGNWERRKLDLDGDGAYTGTGELDDTGTFNVANEWLTRDQDSNAGTTGNNFTLAHDPVGNMTDDGTTYEYEYDVWGRLRKVKRTDNQALVAEYRYNGLGYRISWKYDNDDSMGGGPDGSVDGSDKTYYFAHDERWRVVAVYRGTDSDPKERYLYHAAGLRGQGGSSYIDQVVMRDRDANSGWTSAADGTLEERRYYLQNWRADVSAIIDSTGDIVEWIKYSAYGVPYALIPGDYDRDGDVDSADQSAYISDWGAGSPSADLDESGGVDGDDLTVFGDWYTANTGKVGGRGVLSEESVGNRIGYAGYQWDPATSLNHVRHRVYNPEMGRWTRRDPLGYVDGMNLYTYCRQSPIHWLDPNGLASKAGGVCLACCGAAPCCTDCGLNSDVDAGVDDPVIPPANLLCLIEIAHSRSPRTPRDCGELNYGKRTTVCNGEEISELKFCYQCTGRSFSQDNCVATVCTYIAPNGCKITFDACGCAGDWPISPCPPSSPPPPIGGGISFE